MAKEIDWIKKMKEFGKRYGMDEKPSKLLENKPREEHKKD